MDEANLGLSNVLFGTKVSLQAMRGDIFDFYPYERAECWHKAFSLKNTEILECVSFM